jgi:hypothetical protein
MMHSKKIFLACTAFFGLATFATAQTDSTDLMNQLEKDAAKAGINYTTGTFKTTRLVTGHSVENIGKGVLDVRINHRFGTLNKGGYELFGLDNATMRLGFDYGLSDRFMIGVGRSTFQKTYDAFVKYKLLRQSTGAVNMPFTVSYAGTVALMTLKWVNDSSKINHTFSSRFSYSHQLLIARKFSEGTSLQLMPTFVHRNLVAGATDPNDIWALGIGGRQKISKRTSFNVEYYYQFNKVEGTTNSLSVGFDIETGGHVFQLHFTNSTGMTENNFITGTTGKWQKGDILFGFNISRVFNIGKRN